MSSKTATVIGATGLIGSHLIELLQRDNYYETVRALIRRPVSFTQSKVEPKLVNFDDEESVKLAIDGSDVVFCTVGTTKKKVAGDKNAYRKIDYEIPVNAARFCSETHCPHFLVVSSVGADAGSKNFYLQLKGEMEEAVSDFSIPSVSIFRPSILIGKRNEFRLGEKIGQTLSSFFAFLLIGKWEKYRPIEAAYVASAMLQISKEQSGGAEIYEFNQIREFAKAFRSTSTAIVHPHLVR